MAMGEMFGHRWITNYGAEPSPLWQRGLAGYSPAEIERGVLACLDWRSDFVPTLPEFRQLCRPASAPAHQPMARALPEPEESRERRRAEAAAALGAVREGMAYQDWLRHHADRRRAPLDDVLHSMRALICMAAKLRARGLAA